MKRFAKIFFTLIMLTMVLIIMTGCDGEGTGVEVTIRIKSVIVRSGENIYGVYLANDITQTGITGDSEQFDYAEEIETQADLPGWGYNQHLTLKHNGKTVLEEQAYSAASAKVKLVYGENVFDWYLNLPTDGEKAQKISFTIHHTPPLVLPPLLWVHYGQGVFTLSNLGVKAIATKVETATFADNMTYKATVYHKNADGTKGEEIGDYSTESDATFTLPKGVKYDDVIVELFYSPDSPAGTVPNVIGLSYNDAIETLKAHGFNHTTIWEYNNTMAGRIHNQANAGAKKEIGFTETLYASNGPQPATPEPTPTPDPEPTVIEVTTQLEEGGYKTDRYEDHILVLTSYYNDDNTLTRTEEYNPDGTMKETNFDENGDVAYYIVFEYDENGRVVKETMFGGNGVEQVTVTRKYTPEGFLAEERFFDADGIETSATETKYDNYGRPKKIQNYENGTYKSKTEIEYGSTGVKELTSLYLVIDGAEVLERIITHHDNGYLKSIEYFLVDSLPNGTIKDYYDIDGTYISRHVTEYDSDGRIIKTVIYNIVGGEEVLERTITLTYHANGAIASEKSVLADNTVEYDHQYDESGNLITDSDYPGGSGAVAPGEAEEGPAVDEEEPSD